MPGRFVIWTKNAIAALDEIYAKKSGFHMPAPMIKTTDFKKYFESEAMLKAKKAPVAARIHVHKVNPFTNKAAMEILNPGVKFSK